MYFASIALLANKTYRAMNTGIEEINYANPTQHQRHE